MNDDNRNGLTGITSYDEKVYSIEEQCAFLRRGLDGFREHPERYDGDFVGHVEAILSTVEALAMSDTTETQMNEPMNCDRCGRNVTYKGVNLVAFSTPPVDDLESRDAIAQIYPELRAGERFSICWVCWLGAMRFRGFM